MKATIIFEQLCRLAVTTRNTEIKFSEPHLMKFIFALFFFVSMPIFLEFNSSIMAQPVIRYGDNLNDAVVCGTTDTLVFQGFAGEVVAIHVVELNDYGGICGGTACFCFDQRVELLDFANNILAVTSSPSGNNTQNRFRTTIGPEILPVNGRYKITIRDSQNNGRGEYSIFLQRLNTPERSNPISSGQTILVNLNRGEVDTYEFTARPLDRIIIDMVSGATGNVEPVLELYNSEGMAVAFPGSGHIDQKLSCGGKFYFLAYSKTDQSGPYNVSLKVEMIPNNLPEPNDDYATTDINTYVMIDVLANDKDSDNNILKIASVTQPANGKVLTNDSYVVYDPDIDFIGLNEFSYKVTDYRDTLTVKVHVTVNPVTGIEPGSELYQKFALLDIHPNPFINETKIKYRLPSPTTVNITIYNLYGVKIIELVNGFRTEGNHEIIYNSGGLCAGIYYCIMEAGKLKAMQRMVIME